MFKQRYLENGSSTHRHFITKRMLITARSFITTQRLHSYKFTLVDKTVLSPARLLPFLRTPFSNVVVMRKCSLVPIPVIGLGARLVHMNRELSTAGMDCHGLFSISVVAKAYAVGKALHLAGYL